MSEQTIRAMAFVACVFAIVVLARVAYVMALYRSWTMSELFGFSDDGWESESMKQNRRSFWR